jgi:thioredoxin 1
MARAEGDNVSVFKGSVEEFQGQVCGYDGLVVVTFWAQWCAPCRRLSGMLPQMAAENQKVKFMKVDVDDNPELAEKYEITGIPNVRLFRGAGGDIPVQLAEIQGLDNQALREAIATHSK